MTDNQKAIDYLISKLKWAEIDANIAMRNGSGGVANYKHGEAWAYKAILWELYGMGNEEADAIVSNLINS